MNFRTDPCDRIAYEAAIAAILRHGCLRRAFDHYYRPLEAAAKVRAAAERRTSNDRLARLLTAG